MSIKILENAFKYFFHAPYHCINLNFIFPQGVLEWSVPSDSKIPHIKGFSAYKFMTEIPKDFHKMQENPSFIIVTKYSQLDKIIVTFTPSFSIFITCDTEEEFDTLYQKLIDGGHVLMPIGDYGFASWLFVPKEKVSKLA